MQCNQSDLIFPEQANIKYSHILTELKRSALSISNRLKSILHDAEFAERVSLAFDRPLIANERCGSWYIRPDIKYGSAYFKSTDGHTGVWKFSSRRLNLHLLEIIEIHDGCVIIDSTRRGKRMPDALSKTIPIWCAVLNQCLFPDNPTSHVLHTSPQAVSQSEHEQISTLLPSFTTAFKSLRIPISDLRRHISKPLRPIWITPDSQLEEKCIEFLEFHPIICCTVSTYDRNGDFSEEGYVQGAGDDTENWAHGLTPHVFWANSKKLISASDTELPHLIKALVNEYSANIPLSNSVTHCIEPTASIFITRLVALDPENVETESCLIKLLPKTVEPKISDVQMEVAIGQDKIGSRNLRKALPSIIEFAAEVLSTKKKVETMVVKNRKLIIACQTGLDLSIGVALAILCLFFDDEGNILKIPNPRRYLDKSFIRRRYGWIATSVPDANPSRATLQSVNSFLLS